MTGNGTFSCFVASYIACLLCPFACLLYFCLLSRCLFFEAVNCGTAGVQSHNWGPKVPHVCIVLVSCPPPPGGGGGEVWNTFLVSLHRYLLACFAHLLVCFACACFLAVSFVKRLIVGLQGSSPKIGAFKYHACAWFCFSSTLPSGGGQGMELLFLLHCIVSGLLACLLALPFCLLTLLLLAFSMFRM